MSNDAVATALDEIATLLALKGENDFKCRAYSAAARTVGQLPDDVANLIAAGKLGTVRGLGDALVEKITTLVTTGNLPYLDDLRASVPEGLLTLLRLPGVGPKKVKALYDALGVHSLDTLKAACERDEVAKLKGFGDKTQAKILEGIAFLGTVGNRVRIDLALPLGEMLLARVKAMPGVTAAELCGSLRRRKETTKDIDIVAAAADAGPVMRAFTTLPEVLQVVGHGATKSGIVAKLDLDGHAVVLNADLRVVTAEQFPYALAHFTGSKEHNIRLRQRAIERGLTLNEYGLVGPNGDAGCTSEADIHAALGLQYVPPELREDAGEVELAATYALPKLIEPGDIRGVFHNHTTYSDGTASLEQMALAAKALGYEFFGVGDHSQSLTVANGLTPDRVRKQWAEIDRLNATLTGVRILKGTECDILEDGSLDYDDELLAGFDYVVASVHTLFGLSEEKQTARICRALAHPRVTFLGHPTGRLLLRREGYKVDLGAVIAAAADHGKWLEINAQPSRLDLDWPWVKRAKAAGVKLVINPDAHSPGELGLVPFGVNVARRGGLTADDVVNCRPWKG